MIMITMPIADYEKMKVEKDTTKETLELELMEARKIIDHFKFILETKFRCKVKGSIVEINSFDY